MSYRINLEKEDFKFSVAHFTIFGPNEAERLHGHNYRVRVYATMNETDPVLGLAFDFNLVKPLIRALMKSLDEHVLLPAQSPYLKIEREPGIIRAQFAAKRYELPEEDVLLLPLVNVTCEQLARHLAVELLARMKAQGEASHRGVHTLTVAVEESSGQSVAHEITL